MKLVVAEKPSVAMSIAKALGGIKDKCDGYVKTNKYIATWCYGHLIQLADASAYGAPDKQWSYETLPILPDKFEFKVSNDKEEQFNIVSNLMHSDDVDLIICATDAGREGELIFRQVYNFANCTKPFMRLWISSMEETAIREGFNSLKPGADFDDLYNAALCRAEADWIVGINATRLFSVLYRHKLTVGRVQTPTLYMLVKRQMEIKNFAKEKFFKVALDCGDFEVTSDSIKDEVEAKELQKLTDGEDAVCSSIKEEIKKENPPKLFDLTSLQREANKLIGLTAQQTLDCVQSMYEKKLVTYPRTDSQYLTDDMQESVCKIISLLAENRDDFNLDEKNFGKIYDNKKVSDHHAIIPTMESFKTDISTLSSNEKVVLDLISTRLLCAVSTCYEFKNTVVTLTCKGKDFSTKGKTIVSEGYKAIEDKFISSITAKEKTKEKPIPQLYEGQVIKGVKSKITEHFTSPPKPFTEDTLLSAMENAGKTDITEAVERKGLGTPATRAGIIEKLVSCGFVERTKKQLIPTPAGINLISVMPKVLISPKLTADWENELSRMAHGNSDPSVFMQGIQNMISKIVIENNKPDAEKVSLFSEKKSIGNCPRCQSHIYEGKLNFYCSNQDCSFRLWKNDRFFESQGKSITTKVAEALLQKGKVSLKNLKSQKTGNTYDATVVMNDDGNKTAFSLQFNNKKRKNNGGI